MSTKPPIQLEPKPHGFTITHEIVPTPTSAARWLNACRARHKEAQSPEQLEKVNA